MKSLWNKAKIVARIASLIWALISFSLRFSKAMKLTDTELKKKTILEVMVGLIKDVPYDLPGLISLEFKDNNGGN